jgi:inhibitor of cysteine peptidase
VSALTRWRVVIHAGALLSVAACCAAPVPTMKAEPGGRTLTIKDDGRTIDLRVGVQFALRLEAIPGAGFAWKVVDRGPGLVRVLDEEPPFEVCPKRQTGGPLGAPSCQTFRFEATKTGTGRLRLEYKRPWEEAAPPEKTFTVKLRIQ